MDEPIEVEVRRVGDEAAPEVEREPVDWRRCVVPVCAVIGALSLVVVAWSQMRVAGSAERSACMQETQFLAFGLGNGNVDRDDLRDRLRECGADVPEADD